MALFDFSLIRRSVQSLEDRLKNLRIELNELQRQRGQILAAPMCKADVKAMLTSWVEKSGSTYLEAFKSSVTRLARTPTAYDPNFDPRRMNLRLVGAAQSFGQEPGGAELDAAMCGLFGGLLVTFLATAVDGMDWPAEGLPMADRPGAVAKLDARIGALIQEEATLIQQANEAGISVS